MTQRSIDSLSCLHSLAIPFVITLLLFILLDVLLRLPFLFVSCIDPSLQLKLPLLIINVTANHIEVRLGHFLISVWTGNLEFVCIDSRWSSLVITLTVSL